MTSTLLNPRVRSVVDSMHAASERIDPPLLAKAKGKRLQGRVPRIIEIEGASK